VTAAARQRGFSLLEVMVAVGILALSLTVILSAEGDCFSKDKRAATMGIATTIARCRMTELEEKQLKFGYPLIDEIDSSNVCCNTEEVPGFSCEWKVERVILPILQNNLDGGADMNLGGALFSEAGAGALPTGSSSPLGGLIGGSSGPGLDLDAGLANIGTTLTQQIGGGGMGVQGLLSFVFSLVYPTLKPLMEASIRRITVTVKWKEGLFDRDFTLTQFVTNPQSFPAGTLTDGGLLSDGGGTGLGTGATGAPGSPAAPGAATAPAAPLGGQRLGF
jgi:general secretion pathway protein I